MDPLYRPYFQHVLPICWPWLWWNLVRLTAWRQRTGRAIFILVDKYGNIYTRFIGDAPKAEGVYEYAPPRVMPWERLAPVCDDPVKSGIVMTGHAEVRLSPAMDMHGHVAIRSDLFAKGRGPP